MTTKILSGLWWSLLVLTPAAGRVILNEVVALNDPNGHRAADGIAYDWIELHNTGDLDVDLLGYHLTDDETNLTKWRFPRSLLIPAGGFSVVYASDRNALIESQEHTNFKLSSSNGEYLALVAADGESVLSEFNPGFPPLTLHRSFGPPDPGSPPGVLLDATPKAPNAAAAPVPIIDFFTASSERVEGGDPVIIEWSTKNSDTVILEGSSGHPPVVTVSGTLTLRPRLHQSFTLIARNEYAVVRKALAISVVPTVEKFTASPMTVATGGKTVLRWSSVGSNSAHRLNDLSGYAVTSPLLFTPTNEILIEPDSTWRKAPGTVPPGWENLDFDDSEWPQVTGPIAGKGHYRIEFQVSDPDALTSYTISAPNGSSFGFSLNGTSLPNAENHLPPSLSRFETPVDPALLVPGKNVLTFTVQSSANPLPVKLAAWRPQPEPVEVPITFTSGNEAGEDSQTLSLLVLPPDADLPGLPPVAITEFFWAYHGTFPVEPYRFFEVHNFGESQVDLTEVQLVGSQTFAFADASNAILQPGDYAVIVTDHPTFAESWPGDRNVIGQFENPQSGGTYQFEFREGILDRFGRLFEIIDADEIGVIGDFLDTVERINVHESSQSPDNWYTYTTNHNGLGQGTPGEAPFRILDFSFTPEFASPGDAVTLHWEVSRPADLKISGGLGPLSGTSGSIPLLVPEDARSFSFELSAQTRFQRYEARASLILPPAIASFYQSKTSIVPGEEVRLAWSHLNHNSAWQAVIDPEIPSPVYGSPTITPLVSGFSPKNYWRYRIFSDEPPENWTSADGAKYWRARYAPLGFGEKENLTSELTPSDWISAHFHRSFVIREAGEIERLFLDIRADDGFVVFLNGREVLRQNLPEGEISYKTTALGPAADDGSGYQTFEIDPGDLVEGDNVIAVAVHNVSSNDADFIFDLGLRARRPVPETGRKNYTLTTSNPAGTATAEITILFAEPRSTADWQNENNLIGNPATTDTDGDGLSDLLEFATGTDPFLPNPVPLQVTTNQDRTLTLTYVRNLRTEDVLLSAEVSDDLVNWLNVGGREAGMIFKSSIAPDGSDIALVTYRSSSPVRSGKRYFRLRAR